MHLNHEKVSTVRDALKLSNQQIVKLTNGQINKWSNQQIVKLTNGQINKWSNQQIVNLKHLIEHLCWCTYECGNTVMINLLNHWWFNVNINIECYIMFHHVIFSY